MALNYTVTLTGGTDNGTYTIYYDQVNPSNIATIYGSSTPATNLTLSEVQSGVIVTVPTGTGLIIFVNDNPNFATDCSTNQVVFNIVPDATQPPTATPNPTNQPTPTPNPTNQPTATPNPTNQPTPTPSPSPSPSPQEEITFKFCQCGGEGNVSSSVEAQNFQTTTCIYLTQTQLGGVPNTGDRVFMSDAFCYLYDSQVQGTPTNLTINGSCECASPTPTPSPSPSATPEQLRDLKFVYCTDIATEALNAPIDEEGGKEESEGGGNGPSIPTPTPTTQNLAPTNPPIYLTQNEFGSMPQLGDTLQINDGGTDNKCYEYDSQEVGPAPTGITIINTNQCTCPPSATPTPTPTAQMYTYYISTPSYTFNDLCGESDYNVSTPIQSTASSKQTLLGTDIFDMNGNPYVSNIGSPGNLRYHAVSTVSGTTVQTMLSPWTYIQIDNLGNCVDNGSHSCSQEQENPY